MYRYLDDCDDKMLVEGLGRYADLDIGMGMTFAALGKSSHGLNGRWVW